MVDGKALHQMVHPEDAEPRSPETLCVGEHGDVRFGAQRSTVPSVEPLSTMKKWPTPSVR